jgi:hypothetical protein
MIYKPLHWKLKMEQHESHLIVGVNSDAPKGKLFLLHSDICRITLVNILVIVINHKRRTGLWLRQTEHCNYFIVYMRFVCDFNI